MSVYPDFLSHHMNTIFSSETMLPWKEKSIILGLSCWLLAIPAFITESLIWKIIFVLQASIAYVSDYTYSGVAHWSHGLDRTYATLFAVVQCALCFKVLRLWMALLFVCCGFGCIYASRRSVQDGKYHDYVMWHTTWHVVGSLLLSYLHYQIRKGSSEMYTL